jgi:hypothetical protein
VASAVATEFLTYERPCVPGSLASPTVLVMKIEGYGRRFTFSFVFFLNDFLFRLQLLGTSDSLADRRFIGVSISRRSGERGVMLFAANPGVQF